MTTDRSSISVDIPHREIPDHVPPELVHPYAFGFGKKTEEDAYLTLILLSMPGRRFFMRSMHIWVGNRRG